MPSSSIRRYRPSVTLPDGRCIVGQRPGHAPVTQPEHALRDELAQLIGGVVEAVLPYGRADVLTATAVYEVEPLSSWRVGVRQALTYATQTGLPPALALFGQAPMERVLKLYQQLRDGQPPITLWWHSTGGWRRVTSRADCRRVASKTPRAAARPPLRRDPDEPFEDEALEQIRQARIRRDLAKTRVAEIVQQCRAAGDSWEKIAQALGVTRPAAWERYHAQVKE